MAIIKDTLIITYELSIDTETGEIISTSIVNKEIGKKKSSTKKKKVEEDPNPKITLEQNKLILNSAAQGFMKVQADDKLDIKYEQTGKGLQPVIGTDEAFGTYGSGNRLTKTGTISFRGAKNEELSKYGTCFSVVAHPKKENLFILQSLDGVAPITEELKDDEIADLPFDLNIDDANVEEVDTKFFQL